MTGKLITNTFFISLLLLAISCGSSKHARKSAMPGTWQGTPISIDGDSKDRPSPYPNYDSKAVIAYATSNDKDNLYVTMETGDEMTQLKILKAGMTVWIDTGGEKNTVMSIHYPLPDENNLMEEAKKSDHAQGQTKEEHDFASKQWAQRIKRGIEDATQFTLEGFDNCNGGFMVKETTKCGIKVRMGLDEYKELVWEAAIPFKVLYNKSQITQHDAGRPISVCYAIKGFKRPSASSDNNGGGGGMGNGGGMGGGGMGGRGGMGGGGGRGRGGSGKSPQQDPREHLYESTKTWKLFDIVYKQ